MRPYHRQDYYLAVTTFVLVVFGLIMVASASVVESYAATGSNNYYFIRQSVFAVIGIFLWWFLQKLDYRYWKRWATTLLIVAGVLLVAVLIPGLGVEAGGARRWIGFGDFTLQASEVAKFALVVYLAYWFEKKGREITDFYKTFLPFVLVLVGVFFLVMQEPDLGTALVIALIAGTMYMVAGASWGQLSGLVLAGVAGVLLLIKVAPYRLKRLLTFLNPSADPLGAGYHINQALLAIGSGGIFGLGYGHSRQKYNFLPEPSSDSIFAIIGEELGLIGSVFLVIIPFAIIVWRGLLVARKAPDMFGRMMALGLTCWIGYQAIINIGAIVGLFPLTGVPLPFVSLGGSSLVIMLAASGVLLNISKQTVKSTEDENPLSWWWNWWARYSHTGSSRSIRK
ncbi:TPA: putative lipid II flippase FtsW [Patescibacteria group bacterium]|uniref:Probable peptidoglycan glycosyltransferase FtsW n=2 Tax=Bacteria division Kazan-3B-28 TaxID=1798534 RepID=A0A0G1ZG40_UNCK3|nr:MAG: stage V sporulation protein E, cell division protein FtsW [candidate division Kazan bacterium GW2011_GWA1_50_15]KKW25562.1 MAG: Stage V sporulation protein E [candidate division Kazan bacterium GW2011_GWC1_52_13]KKW26867.1 MAG: Stage V sporulation protein E [candidate division Kazan bacterium GW2011_GWB1_52_7]HAV65862.1 putative lipid II flippase FtsW [Patescibacteria group bacterium]HCL47859.1 putative lipid II flippase FtsW [Patescibacteria group bacterium]